MLIYLQGMTRIISPLQNSFQSLTLLPVVISPKSEHNLLQLTLLKKRIYDTFKNTGKHLSNFTNKKKYNPCRSNVTIGN